jgi:hypothetical protein
MLNKVKTTLISGALALLAGCGGGSESDDGRVAVAATAGEGGTISPATQRVTKGSQATLTVQPSSIYDIQSVTGCGGNLNGTTYQTGAVNADCSVTASFKLKPLAISVSGVSERIAESATTPLTISVENAKNSASVTAKAIGGYGSTFVSIEPASNGMFNLVTKNVDREAAVQLEITAQDGADATRIVTQRLTVLIENSSFSTSLARYKVISANAPRILALTEEKVISKALNDAVAVLALKDNMATSSSVGSSNTSYTDLESRLNQKSVDAYLAGTINDAELTAAMNSIEALMAEHVAPYINSINAVMPKIAALGVPVTSTQTWHINPEINSISLFVGNTELGSISEGAWVFKPEFEYIDGLINSECVL